MLKTDFHNLKSSNLNFDSIPFGFKGIVHLQIKSNEIDELVIPILVIKGNKSGKTIGVFGGVHGDEYDYSLVDYKGDKINVIIICSVHGNFQQFPNNHLVGKGCQKCGRIKATTKQTKSTEDFIKQAKVVFPDGKYDYSKVEYKGSHEKVTIVLRYRRPKLIGKGKEDVVENKEIPYADIKKALVVIKF